MQKNCKNCKLFAELEENPDKGECTFWKTEVSAHDYCVEHKLNDSEEK